MYPILWVLQFKLGQLVIHLLLTPPAPIGLRYLASNCVFWSFIEAVDHSVIVSIHKIVIFFIGLKSLPQLIY